MSDLQRQIQCRAVFISRTGDKIYNVELGIISEGLKTHFIADLHNSFGDI